MAGCVLQWWKLACYSRVFMVSVGIGRLLYLVCMDELGAMLWHHCVVLKAPDPHGGPSMMIIGPSHYWMCGCNTAHGVFMNM